MTSNDNSDLALSTLFHRDALCAHLGIEPSPETMLEIWVTDAEDLLMNLEDASDDLSVQFQLLALNGRLRRCRQNLLHEIDVTVIDRIANACKSIDVSVRQGILERISCADWIVAAEELVQIDDRSEAPDPTPVCDLLDGLDDADLVIAACQDQHIEQTDQLRIQIDDCLLWLRRHPESWLPAAQWILSTGQTFDTEASLQESGLLDTTNKYLLWANQLDQSALVSDSAPFDRISDTEFQRLYEQFVFETTNRVVISMTSMRTQRATGLELAQAASSEAAEQFRKRLEELQGTEANVFELPIGKLGTLSIERVDHQIKLLFVSMTENQTPPVVTIEDAHGVQSRPAWRPLPGGRSHHTELVVAARIHLESDSGIIAIDLVP